MQKAYIQPALATAQEFYRRIYEARTVRLLARAWLLYKGFYRGRWFYYKRWFLKKINISTLTTPLALNRLYLKFRELRRHWKRDFKRKLLFYAIRAYLQTPLGPLCLAARGAITTNAADP